MGMTATQEALERIKEKDPAAHDILQKFWALSFKGGMTALGMNAQLNDNTINTDDPDIKFVMEQINLNISSQ